MFIKLILLFTLVPIVELALLIKIGGYIGIIPTILLVGFTGIIGITLARSQGFKVITKVKAELKRGIIPTDDLISGLLILIGGVMLLTPGLLTDITGFALILPHTRYLIANYVKVKFKRYINNNHIKYQQFNFSNREYYSRQDNFRDDNNEDFVDIDVEKDE